MSASPHRPGGAATSRLRRLAQSVLPPAWKPADAQNFATHLRQRPRRHRSARRTGSLARPGLGPGRAGPAEPARRRQFRPVHRRDPGEPQRLAGHRHDHQRFAARPDPALARRRQRDPAGAQPPRRGHLDPLARHHPAGQHGWRAGPQLRRHRSRRSLRIPLQGPAERHLLVPQPLGATGAGRGLRRPGDRRPRAGTVQLRPRLRGAAQRLVGREAAAHPRQAEEAVRLLQLPQAHRRRLHRRRQRQRLGRDPGRPQDVGRDEDESHRSRRRQRLHLYLPAQRTAAGRQLDRPVPPRRKSSACASSTPRR